MKSFINSKKRWLVAGIAAATLAGGAYAFADSLSVSSNSLGAGSAVVASCQSATLTASYSTAYDATAATSGYKVTSVNLAGVALSCNGKSATLELTGTSGAPLASSGPVSLATGDVNAFGISGVIDAASVKGVSLVITG